MQSLHDLPPLPPGTNLAEIERNALAMQTRLEGAPQQEVQEPIEAEEIQAEEIQSAPVESEASEPTAQPETKQAKNFRELKQQMLRMQRERDAMARQLQEKESQQPGKAVQTQTSSVEDTDLEFRDDEYIEAKHVNKVAQELKKVREQLKQFQSQNTVSLAEQRLRIEFPDFAKVFTGENCQTLAMLDPDLALSIDADTDPYRKAKLAYKSIKNMGIDQGEEFNEHKERIQKNLAKPRSAASVAGTTASPLSKATSFENGLTPELKKQLLREMQNARQGY